MFGVTRKFSFEAAHRLVGHPGKCSRLHGHSYKTEVTVISENLNVNEMVVDFGEMKRTLGAWIDDRLDHNIILWEKDPLAQLLNCEWLQLNWKDDFPNKGDRKVQGCTNVDPIFGYHEPMILDCQPTAEAIARLIKEKAEAVFNLPGMKIRSVSVIETENCCAHAY
jgi:queuosine biosynthesis protein QueD